jgi:hypothetical protein
MKHVSLFLLLAAGMLVSAHSDKRLPEAVRGAVATCVGDSPCKACKNCKYCKRCAKDGKTCGICKK